MRLGPSCMHGPSFMHAANQTIAKVASPLLSLSESPSLPLPPRPPRPPLTCPIIVLYSFLLLTVSGSGATPDTKVAKAFPSSRVMKIARIWNAKPEGGRSIFSSEVEREGGGGIVGRSRRRWCQIKKCCQGGWHRGESDGRHARSNPVQVQTRGRLGIPENPWKTRQHTRQRPTG